VSTTVALRVRFTINETCFRYAHSKPADIDNGKSAMGKLSSETTLSCDPIYAEMPRNSQTPQKRGSGRLGHWRRPTASRFLEGNFWPASQDLARYLSFPMSLMPPNGGYNAAVNSREDFP